MQLSLLIMRGAHSRPLDRPTQPKARLTCLLQGVRPLPAKLQHLAAVDEALAAKRQKLGLGITPCAQRRGPRMDPPKVEQFAARLDHAAIRVAHDDRGHFPGRDRDHRLVQ
jgi:hypothetical protein